MFVTVKELLGVPGLPKTDKGIRQALARSSGGVPELVRMRTGTHALEYHIDCLPPQAREEVQRRHYNTLLQQPPVKAPAVAKTTASSSQLLEIVRQ
ncbi:DNA-binding protein, partial [Candidatus Symbiopectobacterium sp. 'North America']|uniref:DNA-binding protein n=1 Tax=Candidatus Symbiopectobacterium sp. 'North America' TaxID=2794574 RepID=UPI0024548C6E